MTQVNMQPTIAPEEETRKYLCFLLGEKCYGVDICHVKEIIEYMDMTPIPMMPEFLRGAIHLRNKIIPVVDLSQLLGMGQTDIEKRTCIIRSEISINGQAFYIGILVDSVNQVADVSQVDIEPAPSFAGTLNTEFIHGIVNLDEQFTILVNLDQVFSEDEMQKLGEFYTSRG